MATGHRRASDDSESDTNSEGPADLEDAAKDRDAEFLSGSRRRSEREAGD